MKLSKFTGKLGFLNFYMTANPHPGAVASQQPCDIFTLTKDKVEASKW